MVIGEDNIRKEEAFIINDCSNNMTAETGNSEPKLNDCWKQICD